MVALLGEGVAVKRDGAAATGTTPALEEEELLPPEELERQFKAGLNLLDEIDEQMTRADELARQQMHTETQRAMSIQQQRASKADAAQKATWTADMFQRLESSHEHHMQYVTEQFNVQLTSVTESFLTVQQEMVLQQAAQQAELVRLTQESTQATAQAAAQAVPRGCAR